MGWRLVTGIKDSLLLSFKFLVKFLLTNGGPSARINTAVGTAGVAQLVEQLICNQQAGGSSPSTSSKYGGVPEWPNGADCKSVAYRFGGSNPPSSTSKVQRFGYRGRKASGIKGLHLFYAPIFQGCGCF